MVYVDSANIKYRNMVMCHMIADTLDELLNMADQIGVNQKWLQKEEVKGRVHFDICLSKKKKALTLGAKEITRRELGEILSQQKNK